jgi:hypothetical protein
MLTGKKTSNPQDAFTLLNCLHLPARLNSTEAAVFLGFQEHDIAVLVGAKLLEPLGKPAQNSPKYFAAVDVETLSRNRDWLDKATRTLSRHWLRKNQAKREARLKILREEDAA